MSQYPTQAAQDIIARFEAFLLNCKTCGESDKQTSIRKAFEFAYNAHAGKLHRSGIFYIEHLLSVAEIVTQKMKLGSKSVIASLLHHIIEDTDYTLFDLEKHFGEKVASIVGALHKIVDAKAWFKNDDAENFSLLLLTISDDLRVVLIRFADRMHVLQTMREDDKEYREKIANETLQVYAPLAHRLGLYSFKKELEDLGFKQLKPHTYRVLNKAVQGNEEKRNKFITNFSIPIIGELRRQNIDFYIDGRPKTIYSIWKKMKTKNVNFNEVYDLSAIRIIFQVKPGIPELTQCWKIYQIVTQKHTPVPDRLRDWVSVPKSNGYEALHTTVSVDKRFIEVQIRSQRMHEIAELGLAAHWKYKGVSNKKLEFDAQIKEIQRFLADPNVDKGAFLDDFKLNLLSTDILVFTPENEIKTLPQNATVLDFAYTIHTNLAHQCIGAQIDKQIFPITHTLKNGDKVAILSSQTQKPQLNWYHSVVTAKAKLDLRRLFKTELNQLRNQGETLLNQIFLETGRRNSDETIKRLIKHFSSSNYDELILKIGENKISEKHIRKILNISTKFRHTRFWNIKVSLPDSPTSVQKKLLRGLSISTSTADVVCGTGQTESVFHIAPCCKPKPSDEIVMTIANEAEFIVHQKNCTAYKHSKFSGLILEAEWKRQKLWAECYRLHLRGIEKQGMLTELHRIIDNDYTIVLSTVFFKIENGNFKGYADIVIPNFQKLTEALQLLQGIDGIETITVGE